MRNKFIIIIGFSLILIMMGLFMPSSAKHDGIELMMKVSSEHEAVSLASEYNLELESVSSRGIATFFTTQMDQLTTLQANDFVLNAATYVDQGGPPWQRTRNYVDEQYALTMLELFDAWDIVGGSFDVTVAIIDTGIDANHPEFNGRISPLSYNAVSLETGLDAVADDHGHGTMVAGIIGAIRDNEEGIYGIADPIDLLVIKANESGEGRFRDSALIEGIYYAVEQGADMINMSLGGTHINPLVEEALAYAYEQGVVTIGAAGNDSTDTPYYPAAFPNVLSVSAVDENRNIASFSNFGDTIDVSAPGADIVTTVRNSGYGTVNGTSFAAPQVAGVIALMLAHFGPMEVDAIHERLYLTAMDEGEVGYDIYYGHGIVNALNALTAEFVTVSFETFEADALEPLRVIANEPFTLPEAPSLRDHVFDGWYRDNQFDQPFNEGDVVIEDTTLYARYDSAFHTVRLVFENQPDETIIVEHGESITLDDPKQDGYRFEGWYTDATFTTPYENGPVEGDLTLYAKFTKLETYRVDLMVDDEVFDYELVREDQVFAPSAPEKNGHIFSGWYKDASMEIPYEATLINQDTTLYGSFTPETYQITLMKAGEIYAIESVAFGTEYHAPELEDNNDVFVDWFLDTAYEARYFPQLIDGDLTLYAHFVQTVHLVNYTIDDAVVEQLRVADGEIAPQLEIDKKGYTFLGWYKDASFDALYEDETVNDGLTLYGRYARDVLTIRFFSYDRETLIKEVFVESGDDLEAPEGVEKPDDKHFTYTFIGWSEPLEAIYESMDVYPLYERTFIKGSVGLAPGVDTVRAGDTWNDAGVTIDDDILRIERKGTVDDSIPGKYKIEYQLFDNGEKVTSIIRHVRVLRSETPVDITLNPGIETILVGGTYEEVGAQTTEGDIEIEGNVDTSTPGAYEIIYRVNVDGTTYEKVRIVHVIELSMNGLHSLNHAVIIEKGREQYAL